MGRISRVPWSIAEVALSCGLLVGAGLMIKSVTQLQTFDYGFPTDVFSARLGLFETDYPEPADRARFYEELQRRLDEDPGIEAASLMGALPGTYRAGMTRLSIEGESYPNREDHPLANVTSISPGFFDTFEAQLLAGRDFNSEDASDGLQVAIVNATFVERFFPGTNPVGQRFRPGFTEGNENEWLTVVGVAPDLAMEGVGDTGDRPPQGYYVPLAQQDLRFVSIAARSTGDSMRLTNTVRDAVAAVDANLPLYWVRPLQAEINENTWFYRVFGVLFMVFGGVALFLASIGLYGVMAFAVGRREQEVGIRIALGAQGRDVLGLVIRQGLWQVGIGLVLGIGLAMVMSGGLELVLFQVDPHDFSIYGLVLIALGLSGLAACLVPATRASRIDPIQALRA